MKPDSRIDGRKKKKVICIACSWLRASVEKVKPTARLARHEQHRPLNQQREAADHRHLEEQPAAAARITATCT